MTLPPVLQTAFEAFSLEMLLVGLMAASSLFLVAIALERLLALFLVRRSLVSARKVVLAARNGGIAQAVQALGSVRGAARTVFAAGLDRATGQVKGNPAKAMAREQKRLGGALRARTWILGTAGALMPFVGLFGTVIGVMNAFQAIGESGQGGFAIVSVGISQALIATAVGIAVALEAVVLFNILNTIAGGLVRDLAILSDELLELIEHERGSHAGRTAG